MMIDDEMYNATVLDHFNNPRNVGSIIVEPGSLEEPVLMGMGVNEHCGDVIKLYMRVENAMVKEVKSKSFGCVAAIAVASAMTECIRDRNVQDVRNLTNADIVQYLGGLPEEKVNCSVLTERILRKAFEQYDQMLSDQQGEERE